MEMSKYVIFKIVPRFWNEFLQKPFLFRRRIGVPPWNSDFKLFLALGFSVCTFIRRINARIVLRATVLCCSRPTSVTSHPAQTDVRFQSWTLRPIKFICVHFYLWTIFEKTNNKNFPLFIILSIENFCFQYLSCKFATVFNFCFTNVFQFQFCYQELYGQEIHGQLCKKKEPQSAKK